MELANDVLLGLVDEMQWSGVVEVLLPRARTCLRLLEHMTLANLLMPPAFLRTCWFSRSDFTPRQHHSATSSHQNAHNRF